MILIIIVRVEINVVLKDLKKKKNMSDVINNVVLINYLILLIIFCELRVWI